jgi:hypothetical protein
MRVPTQANGTKRFGYLGGSVAHAGIRASLARYGAGAGPKCTCVQHGDSKLFECCKIGTDDCRDCVGENTETCCQNLTSGKPNPVPIPSRVLFAA